MKNITLFFLLLISSITIFAHPENDNVKDTAQAAFDISILSYNVKFLPRAAYFLHHKPVRRSKLIPAEIAKDNPDVIVLQEAFDIVSIRIFRKLTKKEYPYWVGIKNRKPIGYKRAGGVLMFSKYPIKQLESIKYKECKGIVDCTAGKGSLLAEVEHPAKKFQLLGTHMQAGGSKELKATQYVEAGALLKKYEQAGVPQFAAGDFNTRCSDTIMYPKLLSCLNAEDGSICSELKFTSDQLCNDMDEYDPNKRSLIDYIFYKPNGVVAINTTREVRAYEKQWSKKNKSLSDHNALLLRIKF